MYKDRKNGSIGKEEDRKMNLRKEEDRKNESRKGRG